MNNLIIQNGTIVSDNKKFQSTILIENGKIKEISDNIKPKMYLNCEIIDATDKIVMPGIIDTHVHFREPGLTEKADISTESKAAVAGGVTTFFDMPNTIPQTTTIEYLEHKFRLAEEKSVINYSFYIGAANDNEDELAKIDKNKVAGIKLFYASSTGNMLVDKAQAIENIFINAKIPIAIHSEDQPIIVENHKKISSKYEEIPPEQHEFIRSAESCYVATKSLVELAKKHNTKIHFLHITTADELELFSDANISAKNITAEVSPNHLYFDSSDYADLKFLIKCNPSIKSKKHKKALLEGLKNNKIDSIATDHAPHVYEDKFKKYVSVPSGIPSIQHSLNIMLELVQKNELTIKQLVEKMCHNPSKIFEIDKRGFIKEGFWADLVIVDLNEKTEVKKEDLFYKCGWSPLVGKTFNSKIETTIVNGKIVYKYGKILKKNAGKRVEFCR